MTGRLLPILVVAACWAVFLLAIVYPSVAMILAGLGESPDGGWCFSARQWSLLSYSAKLAAWAVGGCLVLSLPGAYAIGQSGQSAGRPAFRLVLMACLLCPPMVYAFGWERLAGTAISGELQCAGVWAMWAWPVPAVLVGGAWLRRGKRAFEAAVLDTSYPGAFIRVVLPLLIRHVTVAALVLFILFFGEYGVPHACGLKVYATELLGWAASSGRVMDTLWPAVLPTAVILLAAAVTVILWRGMATEADTGERGGPASGRQWPRVTLILAVFAVSWMLPIGSLVVELVTLEALHEAWREYGGAMLSSLLIAAASGLVVVATAFGLSTHRGAVWRTIVVWAVLLGVLPGALVGRALVTAYLQVPVIYDHCLIIVLSHVSRFAWIGLLIVWAARSSTPAELLDQAVSDGADRWNLLVRVHLPLQWPLLAMGAAVTGALSLAEVAGSSLVQVPGVRLVSHILIEKFHRFEDGMLVSLSLWLVGVALAAALVGLASSRRAIR